MPHAFSVLLWPFLACVVLVSIHTYLGIHVLSRQVIFVDIALAQIAALGAAAAGLLGHAPGSAAAYAFSLSFAVLAAGVFSVTRTRQGRVPQEAVIGIAYAVASAGAILLADASPHGAEHLKDLLAGSIVWVTPGHVLRTAALYAAIGAVHVALRRRFLLISLDPEEAYRRGVRVRAWDFLFYLLFAAVITTSVQVAGVLLVFGYLIGPAAFAAMFCDGLRGRLVVGWIMGIAVSGAGMAISYDHPTGPTILCAFGVVLAAGGAVRAVRGAARPGRAAALGALVLLALGAAVAFAPRALRAGPSGGHSHEGEHPPQDPPAHSPGRTAAALAASLADDHASVRAEAARRLAARGEASAVPALVRRLEEETDAGVLVAIADALLQLRASAAAPALVAVLARPAADEWVTLRLAEAAAELGAKEALPDLVGLAREGEASAVRRRALATLLRLCRREDAVLADFLSWWAGARDRLRHDPAARAFAAD